MNRQNASQDHTRPVAYDSEGRPLYAAPQPMPPPSPQKQSHVTAAPLSAEGHNFDPRIRVQYANEPNVVHRPRPYQPEVGEISDELKQLHEDSVRRFPTLNLSEGEFVIMSVKRHPIGLIMPMFVTVVLIVVLLGALIAYAAFAADPVTGQPEQIGAVALGLLGAIMIVGLGGYAAVWVYLQNTFYLTNESVIQEIQHSLFSKHEQTVSLGSIEDASFRQVGILQSTLNYGTIRLSTEGEETTYRFQYVANPKQQIATLNNAVESFKNGRPVWRGDD
ncbi:hypothetical protein CR970_04400 [Candidatus Saccharibacteria bacterium]|nr:MAG: hypothetical protein CR970_04400 [Candidatus Saccharibacteria bacterium]